MPSPAFVTQRFFSKPMGVAILALLLAGCAQQQTPGYYSTAHDSTEADAQAHAQGRAAARAPSQVQLGFGGDRSTQQSPTESAQPEQATTIKARALSEPKTFLGTVPCLTGQSGCSATRVTLTLAPGGEWRSRTVFLDKPTAEHNITQLGCWDIVGTSPLRIILQNQNESSVANLTFVNDNVLRINMINDIRPALDYHLTRQADLDGIDEITAKTPLSCN